MKTITDYVNDLYNKFGSDYKTAKALKVNKELIYQVRKRGKCSDETAVKMAELLEVPKEELLIAAAIARSNDTVKAAWENISRKAGLTAGFVWAGGCASPALLHAVAVKFEAISCILCKIAERKFLATFKSFDRRKNGRILLNADEGWNFPERRGHDV